MQFPLLKFRALYPQRSNPLTEPTFAEVGPYYICPTDIASISPMPKEPRVALIYMRGNKYPVYVASTPAMVTEARGAALKSVEALEAEDSGLEAVPWEKFQR